MAKLKIVIHPLFFVFGLYFAFIGKVFSFIVVVLTAVVHEFGHFCASERCGYKLNRIMLMPYGAVISGDLEVLSYRDEIFVAFAGPIVNFFIVIFFVALWWVFPETYAWTDIVVATNLSVAAINLLPCYPLDGGRILLATLALYVPRKIALKICKIIGLLLSLGLFALFLYSCFHAFNLSLLFFSLFVFFGVISKSEKNSYIRIYSDLSQKQFEKGVQIEQVAISVDAKIIDLYRLVGTKPCSVSVIKDGKIVRNLDVLSVQKLLARADLYASISVALS